MKIKKIKPPVPVSPEKEIQSFTFTVPVKYTIIIKGKSKREAYNKMRSIFSWLHDCIGKWFINRPLDSSVVDNWIVFPELKDME